MSGNARWALLLWALSLGTFAAPAPEPARPGQMLRFDARFDLLAPQHARLEPIAEGFTWVEGPVWHKAAGYLLFSDIPAKLYRIALRTEGVDF